jgi:hypothetical protein
MPRANSRLRLRPKRRCRTSSTAARAQNAAVDAATPVATGVDINALNFRYRIEGDNRLADPSGIWAFDFAGQLPRFRIFLISATIGIENADQAW